MRHRLAVIAALCMLCTSSARSDNSHGLPDGEVTRFGPVTARLIGPTTKYAHGALGDTIEAEGFEVRLGGQPVVFRLPEHEVFEDRRVRLIDIDGDGTPEALVIKASLFDGASLVLYRLSSQGIRVMAESAAIGQPFRWLNPVGVVRVRGETRIAAVITPHISGSLRLYRIAGDQLVESGRLDGVTNHINGARNLDLAVIEKKGEDDVIVLPSLDRRSLVRVALTGGHPQIIARTETGGARIVSLRRAANGLYAVRLDSGAERTLSMD